MAGAPVQARQPLPPRGHKAHTTPAPPPALLLANNAAGGSNGTTVTQGSGGNSGGASGNFFDTVSIGTGAALTFDNSQFTRPAMSYKIALGTSLAQCWLGWAPNTVGSQSTIWFRVYAFLTAYPSVNTPLFAPFQGASKAAQLQITGTGFLRWQTPANAAILTGTTKLPLGSWFRVEGFVTGSPNNGQVEARLFWPADSQAPIEVDTSSATQPLLGPINSARFGAATSVTETVAFTMWLGNLAVSTTGYPGPANLTAAPSAGQPSRPRIPARSPRDRGDVRSGPGAPVANPVAGVPFPPWQHPAAARQPLPPAGRCASSPGAPVVNPVPGAAFPAWHAPAQARQPLPPRGRAAGTGPPPAAVTLANSFQTGQAAGTNVTAGNSGQGSAGAAFDSVVTTGGTVAYDNANLLHGGLDCKVQATSAGANYVSWIKSLGQQPQLWFRVYVYLNALPTQNLWLFSALAGSALCARFGITPAGNVLVQSAGQTSVATSVTVVPAGTGNWFRLEGYTGGLSGVLQARLFIQPDSPVPAEQLSAQSQTGVPDRVRFGITAAAGAQGPLWIDDVAVTSTGWLGPSSSVAEPSQGFPAQARIPAPSPRSRGQVASSPVAAAAGGPQTGPPFTQATQPAQARRPLLPAGRARAGGQGAPVANPVQRGAAASHGQPAQARQPLPPRGGRTVSSAGAPLRNPQAGPKLTPLQGPAAAKRPLPPKGRAAGSKGAPAGAPTSGPALTPLRQAVRAKAPRTWRGAGQHGSPGAAVRNPHPGAAFRAWHAPAQARRPLPPHGWAGTSGASPVVNPLPPLPVYAPGGFHGNNILTGPPASVLAAVLREPGDGSAAGERQRATFTTTAYTTAYPLLPSLITEVVWL